MDGRKVKTLKKLLVTFMAAVMFLGTALAVVPEKASAATYTYNLNYMGVVVYKKANAASHTGVVLWPADNLKVKLIQNYTPKVAKVKVKKVGKTYVALVKFKKVDTAHFAVETQSGNIQEIYMSREPMYTLAKSLSIGKKKFSIKYNSAYSGKKISGKLKIKLKNGVQILEIYTYNFKTGAKTRYNNGDKVSVGKYENLIIKLYDPSTGHYDCYRYYGPGILPDKW